MKVFKLRLLYIFDGRFHPICSINSYSSFSSKHSAKHSTCNSTFNPHNNLMIQAGIKTLTLETFYGKHQAHTKTFL